MASTEGVPPDKKLSILTVSTSKGLSTFELVPAEIRREIYQYLLKAKHVRQPLDEFMIRHYHFETVILGVNKKIYNEACPVLYRENHFIQVSCNWETFPLTMANHEVAALMTTKPKLVSRFKEHVLHLHITIPWANSPSEHGNKNKNALISFLLISMEIPALVRLLRILNATCATSSYKLSFRFRTSDGKSDLALQKSLLEPFRNITVWDEHLKVSGAVDDACVADMRKNMQPTVMWVCGEAWKLYDLIATIKFVGDQAYRVENWDQAFARYEDCQTAFDVALHNQKRFADFGDEGFHASREQLILNCQLNIVLVTLKAKEYEGVISIGKITLDKRGTLFDPVAKSKLIHYRAIALAVTKQSKAALIAFEKAYQIDPTNHEAKRHLHIMRLRLKGKTSAEITPDRLERPILLPEKVVLPSQFIAGERYLLKRQGYTGDMLDGIAESKPADLKKMEKAAKSHDKPIAAKQKSLGGGSSMTWVGAGHRPLYGAGLFYHF